MRFTFDGFCNPDGSWGLSVHVPNGETVMARDFIDIILVPSLAALHEKRHTRLPTEAEEIALAKEREEAMRLPDGWEETLDGVNVQLALDTGGRTFTKAFLRTADGAKCDAPVLDLTGARVLETGAALRAYDAANPVVVNDAKPTPAEA